MSGFQILPLSLLVIRRSVAQKAAYWHIKRKLVYPTLDQMSRTKRKTKKYYFGNLKLAFSKTMAVKKIAMKSFCYSQSTLNCRPLHQSLNWHTQHGWCEKQGCFVGQLSKIMSVYIKIRVTYKLRCYINCLTTLKGLVMPRIVYTEKYFSFFFSIEF